MESEKASKALNEISLYQQYLESVFFDYNMPDISNRARGSGMKTKKFKLGLIAKIMAVAVISIIITAAVLVSVSVMRLGRTYEDLIVEELMRDADESVEAMRSLSDNFDRQEQQLDMTKESMDRMAEGIAKVTQSSQDISGSLNGLQEARSTLNRIIADLSDISGENATATEQTNASMEELSSTFQLINSDAEKLRSLAAELTETISYFH